MQQSQRKIHKTPTLCEQRVKICRFKHIIAPSHRQNQNLQILNKLVNYIKKTVHVTLLLYLHSGTILIFTGMCKLGNETHISSPCNGLSSKA